MSNDISTKHAYDRGFEDCLAQSTNLNLIDHYRENLYEVLELFRKPFIKILMIGKVQMTGCSQN